jgi:hypothetical protein
LPIKSNFGDHIVIPADNIISPCGCRHPPISELLQHASKRALYYKLIVHCSVGQVNGRVSYLSNKNDTHYAS